MSVITEIQKQALERAAQPMSREAALRCAAQLRQQFGQKLGNELLVQLGNRDMKGLAILSELSRQAELSLGDSPLPADGMITVKYPSIDPLGVYSDVDAAVHARVNAIRANEPFLTDAGQSAVAVLNAELTADENGHLLAKGMQEYSSLGQQMRLLDRMMQMCGREKAFENVKKNLENTKAKMSGESYKTEAMKYLDQTLDAYEVVAGVKDKRRMDANEGRTLSSLGLNSESWMQGNPEVFDPKKLMENRGMTIPGYENVLRTNRYVNPTNWGKPEKEWSNDGTDMNRHGRAMVRQAELRAEAMVKPVMDRLMEQVKTSVGNGKPISPLDLVAVNGRTGRELYRELEEQELKLASDPQARQKQPGYGVTRNALDHPDSFKEVYDYTLVLAATALANGDPVSVLVPDGKGGIAPDPVILENDKRHQLEPPTNKLEQPAVKLWQRMGEEMQLPRGRANLVEQYNAVERLKENPDLGVKELEAPTLEAPSMKHRQLTKRK